MDANALILVNLALRGIPSHYPSLSNSIVTAGDLTTLVAAGLTVDAARRLESLRRGNAVAKEREQARRLDVRVVVRGEATYPADLIDHPYGPRVIYVRGGAIPDRPRIAIVGARRASTSMCRFAHDLARSCAQAGIAVVSGLARGIDAAAHRGALQGHGALIGVLGCGVDVSYPPDTAELRDRVAENGCVLATWPLATPPLKHHFPIRNRLLAALADAVVVVQATRESGSMSTARAALDAGIEVLAVPGSPDDPLAEGTNCLIRDGARPVLEARDALEAVLGVGCPRQAETRPQRPLDPLLIEIGSVARSPDQIASALEIPIAEVLERLLAFELRGEVEREPGGVFRRCKPPSLETARLSENPLRNERANPDEKGRK